MRVIKHYKSDGLVRCAERLPRWTQEWEKSAQVYTEHPSTRGMGVEADDLHLSDLINGRIEGNILN